jgi:hypothetical protein
MSGPERKSVEERQARLGRNEALFRVINERMSELNETFAAVTAGKFEIVCECGDSACVQQILIPRAEDARVRTDPRLFVLSPGHEDASVEAVVQDDRGTAYLVVRKHPDVPTDLAVEEAPDS